MDALVGVMIDVEKALNMCMEKDLYSAGLDFFSALGYPVEPLEIAINESMSRFVYYISKNHCIFGSDETKIMHSVASISWLFTLSNNVKELSHVQNVIIENKLISSISCLCVELDCALNDRSILASNLTKIICKVLDSPVVVLFKHADQVLMASMFMINGVEAKDLKTFLSDWYPFNPVQEDALMTLASWTFDNYCDANFYMLYMDLAYTIARPYLFNEDYGFLNFNPNSSAVSTYFENDEVIVINGIRYFCPVIIYEKIYEIDPREFYGSDYVNDKETIEVLTDDPEWMFDDLFDQEEFEPDSMNGEDDLDNDGGRFENNGELLINEGFSQEAIDYSSLDDEILNDPIKMLEYINGLKIR
ncbi:hypothetical protein UF75_2077 [Desulfosporosinus sp. I2]|uniref:hypothetical protein n=1 Tax=Desulfosporosinus sp. I2 TaxID=1617025 RepID=UPI0005ED742F|nr:hypothetical protein [Desulfosporosinus sp. I2]KJR47499.1 hypothetical protein UF75_2077 [Desulfosporosinus sp. I2]